MCKQQNLNHLVLINANAINLRRHILITVRQFHMPNMCRKVTPLITILHAVVLLLLFLTLPATSQLIHIISTCYLGLYQNPDWNYFRSPEPPRKINLEERPHRRQSGGWFFGHHIDTQIPATTGCQSLEGIEGIDKLVSSYVVYDCACYFYKDLGCKEGLFSATNRSDGDLGRSELISSS